MTPYSLFKFFSVVRKKRDQNYTENEQGLSVKVPFQTLRKFLPNLYLLAYTR